MDIGKLKGHSALWLANVIWGLNAPICKEVLRSASHPEGINPFVLTVLRMVGAALLFWLFSFMTQSERVERKDLLLLFFASVFGIQLNQMLFLWGLSLTSPVDSSIIATVVPILTMILAMLFLGEPITCKKAGGVLLGAIGAIVLVWQSSRGVVRSVSAFGDILCIISAASYAVYLTAFRHVIVKYSAVTTMKWMFLFAAVASVLVYAQPLVAEDYAALSGDTWAGIGYVVVCSTFLAYLMVPISQRYLRPTLVSMYNYLQPVVAVVFTVIIGLDIFTLPKALAALCVFLGVWLVTRSKSRAQLEAEHRSEAKQ